MLSWNSIRSHLQFALLFAISTFSKGVWLLLAEKFNASGQLQAGRNRKLDPKGLTILPHLCHICEIPWRLDGSKENWKQTRAQWGGDSHSKLDRHLMYRSVELCPISLMANLCHVLCAGRFHQALRSQFGSCMNAPRTLLPVCNSGCPTTICRKRCRPSLLCSITSSENRLVNTFPGSGGMVTLAVSRSRTSRKYSKSE